MSFNVLSSMRILAVAWISWLTIKISMTFAICSRRTGMLCSAICNKLRKRKFVLDGLSNRDLGL